MIDDGMKVMQQILTKLANKIIAHLSQINRITLVVYSLVLKPHFELKTRVEECWIEK